MTTTTGTELSRTTRTTSRSTRIRIRCSGGSARRRRCTATTTYDFYALSRFDDVERGLVDRETYISGRGAILELIKADIEMPPGVIIFEDPPIHTMHRSLLSRVFTPKKMNALEPQIREFCARSLDPLVGADGFDFVRDLGAQMPMRVIGMLLGIPEEDQEAIRDQVRRRAADRAGEADEVLAGAASRPARRSPTTSTGGPSTRPTTS